MVFFFLLLGRFQFDPFLNNDLDWLIYLGILTFFLLASLLVSNYSDIRGYFRRKWDRAHPP